MRASQRQRSQWIIASVLGVVALGGLWFISQILNNQGGAFATASQDSGIETTMIADRTRAASPEMSWINNAEEKVELLAQSVERLEAALTTTQNNAAQERVQEQKEMDRILAVYEKKITDLEGQLQQSAEQQTAGAASPGAGGGFSLKHGNLGEFVTPSSAVRTPTNPLGSFAPQGQGGQAGTPAAVPGVGGALPFEPLPFARDFALASTGGEEGEEDHPPHLKEYLPAGSYAPALVLSGVDASTSVTSQAEPIPVVFRITGPAVTAGTRSTVGHTIDLTGCTVTGSARGDLSSERVYVRLLKLSCVQSGHHVFERDVAGYMSGAGKAGARGRVVSREGPLVRNAGVAGALAGLAEGFSSVGSAGAGADQASFSEALQGAGAASVGGGISGAADRLSEYYIERAEQYQPVVSLYGGTNVELVFLEGVDLAR